MNKQQKEQYDKLIIYLNNNPKIQSLLYDLDLLPEQLIQGSKDWDRMVKIIKESLINSDIKKFKIVKGFHTILAEILIHENKYE